MSYQRSFHSSVTVSGSVSISYPASQHGGVRSASYSKTVPIDINIYVDTDDFDNSVNSVNGYIDLLTGAVTALDAAECEVIDESSKKISNAMIDGFFSTIKSDITTQKAEMSSELKAKFALLMNLNKDVIQKHERMDDDISKLRKHYFTIFSGLDDDLKRRIQRIDEPSFKLNEIRNNVINNPYKAGVSFSVSQTKENLYVNNLLVNARLKKKTLDVISTISNYIEKSKIYNNAINQLFNNENIEKTSKLYIPVIYASYKNDDIKYNVFVPEKYNNKEISDKLVEYMTSDNNNSWTNYNDAEFNAVEQEFIHYMENNVDSNVDSNVQKRINDEIIKMWNTNRNMIKHI